MKREVYIDNERVDMPEGDDAAIVYNNPVFVEASKMSVNRTTTFKVPATAGNRGKLGFSDMVNVLTDYPRVLHKLVEYRDGLPIIKNGQAKLLQTTPDNFEFSVTWGVLKNFQEMLKAKLTELPSVTIPWNESSYFWPIYGNPQLRPEFAFLKTQSVKPYREEVEFDMKYHFPHANIVYVLEQVIASNLDVSFDFEPGLRYEMRDYYMALLTKNSEVDESDTAPRSIFELYNSRYPIMYVSWEFLRDDLGLVKSTGSHPKTGRCMLENKRYKVKVEALFTRALGFSSWVGYEVDGGRLLFIVGSSSGAEYKYIHFTMVDDTRIEVSGEIDIDNTSSVMNENPLDLLIVIGTYGGIGTGRALNASNGMFPDGIQGYVRATAYEGENEIEFGEDFPLTPNLPNMSVMDYIKNLCFFFGLYVTASGNNTIKFNRIDSIINKLDTPVNIDKLILARKAKKQKFTYSDYAQMNWLRFAEDDTVKTNGDAAITIQDATLSNEKDMFKLSFAASDTGEDGSAIVEIFKIEIDEALTYEYQGGSLKPRILKFMPDGEGLFGLGVFDDSMRFENRIGTHYRVMSAILSNARVVNVDVHIDNITLYNFDETGVFYFYGYYWLLITGTVSNNILSGEFIQFPQI